MGTPIEGGEVQGGNPNPEGLGDGDSASGPNPAWNDVLGVIPESLHQAVTPHFQKWDQAAQQRIEQVNSQVGQFEPYKPFLDNGISPEDLEQGLQLMYQLNTNPQGVYEALAQAYNFEQQQQQQAQVASQGDGTENGAEPADPRFEQFQSEQQRLQEGLDLVAQTILQQQQQKLEQEASAQIDTEVEGLKQKYPGISEEFIYSLMVNGFEPNSVGEKWDAVTQNILQQNPRPFAPNVMGSNGGGTGLPSQAIDPTKLSGPDRRSLVTQMIQAMNKQP